MFIGEGSNGVVYSASWHGAKVAVKFLLGEKDDSLHLERCFTEAVLSRVLSHPCVVQCFATAIAQLTEAVQADLRARCRKHQSLMQSSSVGRIVAATVRLQPDPQPLAHRALSAPHVLPVFGCSEGGSSGAQRQQQQHRIADDWSETDERGSGACGAQGDASTCADAEAEQRAALDMQKMQSYFADEAPRSLDSDPAGEGEGEGCGVNVLQALADLQAEPGRHVTVVVLEFMDGGTLHDAITRGEFNARRSLEHRPKLLSLLLTAQEMAQGMAHLHGLDILHGDLKPTNVLLKGTPCQYAPAGTAGSNGFTCTDPRGFSSKVADLGLARPCQGGQSALLTSDQWGALAYLAPEAAKGSVCKASDVYSFGVMLWECAAGVRPYLGLTTPQVLQGLVTGTLQLTWPSDGSIYAPLRSLGIACTDPVASERPSFEVAARILGRMVRHIRSASEPLRQRHNSAMSMDAAGPGLKGAAGGGGGVGHGSSPSNKGHLLLHGPARASPGHAPATPKLQARAGGFAGAPPGAGPRAAAPVVSALTGGGAAAAAGALGAFPHSAVASKRSSTAEGCSGGGGGCRTSPAPGAYPRTRMAVTTTGACAEPERSSAAAGGGGDGGGGLGAVEEGCWSAASHSRHPES